MPGVRAPKPADAERLDGFGFRPAERVRRSGHTPYATPLARCVVQDIKRLSRREVISSRHGANCRNRLPSIIESPVFREQVGLWAHQKHFIKLAFDAPRGPFGACFILADQVGLGKTLQQTLQLGATAELMALSGDKPILVLAPGR